MSRIRNLRVDRMIMSNKFLGTCIRYIGVLNALLYTWVAYEGSKWKQATAPANKSITSFLQVARCFLGNIQ